jgi:hypothetical protein
VLTNVPVEGVDARPRRTRRSWVIAIDATGE